MLYLSSFRIDTEFLGEYLDWFAARHVPDLLGVGFTSITGYLRDDRSAVCNLYVIPGVEVFGPEYQALTPVDPFRPRLAEHVHDGVRGVYRTTWSAGDLVAPAWLSVVPAMGVDTAAPTPRELESLAGDPAFVAAALGSLVEAPVATDDAPRWRLVTGWSGPTPAAPGPLLRRLDAG